MYYQLLACPKEHLKHYYPCSIPFNEENAPHDDQFPLGMNDNGEQCKMSPYKLQRQYRQIQHEPTVQYQLNDPKNVFLL